MNPVKQLGAAPTWAKLGQLALLVTASTAVNCQCLERPFYNAAVNRWNGAYMGGGNSQTRPFPMGSRAATVTEPALLEIEAVEEGVALHVWLDDSAPVVRAFVDQANATDELQRVELTIGPDKSVSYIIGWSQLEQQAANSRALVIELVDDQGMGNRAHYTADDAINRLAQRNILTATGAHAGKEDE